MTFFRNKRKDFSIQPPKQQVGAIPFFVSDSSNIDFTLNNLTLTADLTLTGVTAGTYGSSTQVPVLQIDQWGRVTGVTLQSISTSGLALETNGTPNGNQTLLNLVAGTNMTITDDGLGNITFDAAGSGSGSLLNDTTGILFGGVLSATIGGTTFNLTAGIGQIVTQTASITGVVTTVNNVTWSAVTAIPITNIGTSQFTYILVDNTGAVIQQTTPFTDAQYKTHIIIGILCHIDFASVNLVTNAQNVAYEDPHRLVELISAFGPIKKTGLNIGPNGTNLRINRTSGEVFKIGSNYITDQFEPDVDTISAQTPALLCRVYKNGSGGFIFDTNGGSYYNDVDPNNYDNGTGSLAPVLSNRWTIQRLFFFPNNPNDIICYYGVQLYNSFSEARAGVEFEVFDEAQITAENAVFLGYLFVRHSATDLTNSTFAAFLQSGLFRGIPPGGGGSGGGSFVPTTRNITINGLTQDLSADRTWTIPTVPPESVYPYIKNQYFRSLDMSCGQYANNLLFLGGNLQNQVIVVNTQTGDPITTTAFDRPIAASKITSLGTPESWITANTSVTTVCRHNLTTGAFIAATALTGVVTNAQSSKFVDFNSTKTIGHNLTQIYNVNPSIFVTTNVTTHGLGSFCMSALNTNGASAQNGVLMLGGSNGIVLYDCNTSTVTLSATTLGGIIGPVQDIIYIPSLDTYAVYTTLSGNQRIVYLQVTGATTFTQTLSITNLSNFNVSLTYPTAQIRFKMFADAAINELFVMVNNRLSVFNLTTGALLKSDIYSSFGAGNFPIVADIDTSNNRLFFSTGGTSPSTVFELIYT